MSDLTKYIGTAEAIRAQLDGDAPSSPFVFWPDFWDTDHKNEDWLFRPVLPRGRGIAIFSPAKMGKSLLALAVAVDLARRGIHVVYLDWENGPDDLRERLEDMGYGAHSDLSRLHYAMLPTLPPLDTNTGAKHLFRWIDELHAEHVCVIIDTTARAVEGEENSADTIRGFYRHTGIGLKQRGVTWVRLDHAGKDLGRGQRGSSAKGDDVDLIWNLSRTDQGIVLKREASRVSWVPAKVSFRQLDDPLRFEQVAQDWPKGTEEIAALLDGLGVDLNISGRQACTVLREAGHSRSNDLIRAAVKFRRQRDEAGQK